MRAAQDLGRGAARGRSMAWRFRKSFRLLPGVRLNVGSAGASISLGPRGASVSIGPRGTYANASIPGSGLSSRQKLFGGASARRPRPAAPEPVMQRLRVSVQVEADGTLAYRDTEGRPLPEDLVTQLRQQHSDQIVGLLRTAASQYNETLSRLAQAHLDTPAPVTPRHEPARFTEERPTPPHDTQYGFLDKLMASRRARIDEGNARARATYERELAAWEQRLREHQAREAEHQRLLEHGLYEDVQAMEDFLTGSLADIDWPRQTFVSFELDAGGAALAIDVDLPEIEDLPDRQADLCLRPLKVSYKPIPDAERRRLYARHVAAVAFRVVGEAFASLPKVQRVTLSAFTQRPEAATGDTRDVYLLSVQVDRQRWERLRFDRLDKLEPLAALQQFDCRCELNLRNVFKPVEPFAGIGEPVGQPD